MPSLEDCQQIVVGRFKGDLPPPPVPLIPWLNPFPLTSAVPSCKPPADLEMTCRLSIAKISLSFQRAGTGRYAGLKVPTVCAHSPLLGCPGRHSSLSNSGPVCFPGSDAPCATVDLLSVLPWTLVVAPCDPVPAPSEASCDVG